MVLLTTILIIIGFLLLLVIILYNGLVSLRNSVKNSWHGIDIQLKRRNDLIPNLVNVVKGYAKHEKQVLENITKARSAIIAASKINDVKAAAASDNMLSGALKSLFAVTENYPDLKANDNFLKLQEELTKTENQIAASRRIYNENVTLFNTKLEVFPNNIFATIFGFKNFDLYSADKSEKKNVEMNV